MPRSARHSVPPSRSGGGFLLGMFVGLVIGLGIALGVAFFLNKAPLPFIGGKPRPAVSKDGKDADAARTAAVAGMPQGAAKGADKPKFDFYKILPGGEEPVSEKELKDAAKGGKNQPETARGVYFIQAGSFQNPADADNQKAKIAILGFESAVEPTLLPDKGTWYRVRLGPYTGLEDLNRVRRALSQNGIDASLVKVKDVAAKAN
ncbi:MAG: SPOR domain-containing protein [Candidatus Parcubacteria bacterium]|nr:SPOR domain-containing protein [Burkholderiales bacterium]